MTRENTLEAEIIMEFLTLPEITITICLLRCTGVFPVHPCEVIPKT